MHILFESHGINEFGESETNHAYRLVMGAVGYAQVSIVMPERWVECAPSLADAGVNVITVPYDSRRYPLNSSFEYMYSEFSRMSRRATRGLIGDVDVVHRLNPNAVRFASSLAFAGRPFVIGPLGWSRLPPRWADDPASIARNALKSVDRARLNLPTTKLARMYERAYLIALSSGFARHPFPRHVQDKVTLVNEWIDTEMHQVAAPAKNEVPVILYVGRLIPYKGVEQLIEALWECRNLDWRLRIVGDGPLRDALRSQIARCQLSERVDFFGRVPRAEVDQHLAAADICCFPGLNESFGTVNVEAMSAGRPLIVADWAGPREIVTDECGIRVPVTTRKDFVDGLAKALRRLIVDEDVRLRMGQAGRERVEAVYDVEYALRRFRSVYECASAGIPVAECLDRCG